ncbi:helix-turn-helix domain-containing protein [Propionivibrio sp.]|uniref:helix-turn-helix domain-containing protein n=1 Tax=Propionivibrio sp. TaxID=2212460 RepID=UPI003BF0DA32
MRKLSDAPTLGGGAESSTENRTTGKTLASRLVLIIGSESVASFARRSGVGESLLRKYLNGAQPNASNLVLLADAGGCSIDWLAAGRPPRMRADISDNAKGLEDASVVGNEFLVLKQYRAADSDQKTAVRVLLEAIEHPSGGAWYRAGQAITNIANIFPRKKD